MLDPAGLDAAVLNLVVNARDAMSEGGMITIITSIKGMAGDDMRGSGSFVHLAVTDTGQGMSTEVLRQVFDRYFTTKGRAGTGLGFPHWPQWCRRR